MQIKGGEAGTSLRPLPVSAASHAHCPGSLPGTHKLHYPAHDGKVVRMVSGPPLLEMPHLGLPCSTVAGMPE